MKRILSTLSVATIVLAMTAFGYAQTTTPECCLQDSACCHKANVCCHKVPAAAKAPAAGCCDHGAAKSGTATAK